MKKKLLSLIALLSLLLVPICSVRADDYFKANDNVSDSEVVNHSLFMAGNGVKSNGKVNGISFLAGNSVEVSGTTSYGFIGGNIVTIKGEIENDAFLAGSNVIIDKEATIGRDVFIAANEVTINADIKGNAFIAGSIINLNNITINGDLKVTTSQLVISDDVTITGKLVINEDAKINNESSLKSASKETYRYEIQTEDVSNVLISILTTFFTGIVLTLLIPKVFKKLDYKLQIEDVFKKILYGLATLIFIPVIFIILLMLRVGVSVGAILIMLYIISVMLAKIFASYVIGKELYTKAFKQKDNIYLDMLIGIAVVEVIALIPAAGPIVTFFVFAYGLGLITRLFLNREK